MHVIYHTITLLTRLCCRLGPASLLYKEDGIYVLLVLYSVSHSLATDKLCSTEPKNHYVTVEAMTLPEVVDQSEHSILVTYSICHLWDFSYNELSYA